MNRRLRAGIWRCIQRQTASLAAPEGRRRGAIWSPTPRLAMDPDSARVADQSDDALREQGDHRQPNCTQARCGARRRCTGRHPHHLRWHLPAVPAPGRAGGEESQPGQSRRRPGPCARYTGPPDLPGPVNTRRHAYNVLPLAGACRRRSGETDEEQKLRTSHARSCTPGPAGLRNLRTRTVSPTYCRHAEFATTQPERAIEILSAAPGRPVGRPTPLDAAGRDPSSSPDRRPGGAEGKGLVILSERQPPQGAALNASRSPRWSARLSPARRARAGDRPSPRTAEAILAPG